MITSPRNEKLKVVRKLRERRERDRTGLFVAEGEDLVDAAAAAGAEAEFVLRAGVDVEPALLDAVSALGSGTRVVGVYRQRWVEPHGSAAGAATAPWLSLYLHGVGDPGNVGAAIRAAHALCDGPVALGPGCADPYSPKAVRASMGSVFARPPARARLGGLNGQKVALDPAAEESIAAVSPSPPVVVCLGSERKGLPREVATEADAVVSIPMRPDAPDSLNVAAAAAIALYELANRMAGHV